MEKNTEYLQLLHDPPVRLTISQKRLLNPQPVEPFEEVHVVPLEVITDGICEFIF